jgi:hypothetical protein
MLKGAVLSIGTPRFKCYKEQISNLLKIKMALIFLENKLNPF